MYDTIRTFGRIVDVNMNSLTDKGIAIVTFSTKMAANKMINAGVMTCITSNNRKIEAICERLVSAHPVQNRKAKDVNPSQKSRRDHYKY